MAKNKNRWKIQLTATLLSNPFLSHFATGKLYKGKLKSLCVPGLNCYSCPAAAASCPIGALQSVIGSSKFHFAYYVVGFLILIGVLLGRVVCGFLCPFGWFQELLHKIPTKKFSTKKLHFLTYLKYVILVVFVIVLPMTVVNEVGMGDPFFCKYLCPAGILEGAIPLSLTDSGIRAALGWLFTWKSCLLLGIILLAVFFYRPFCKWICPLGAFYALFNKVSLYRFQIDSEKCTSCGACSHVCKIGYQCISLSKPYRMYPMRGLYQNLPAPCHQQIIFCPKSKPQGGLYYMKKIVNLLLALSISVAVFSGCSSEKSDLVSKTPFPEFSETDTEGNTIDNSIFSEYDVTIVNFWSNGCGSCVEEMPDLEKMYQELKEKKINLIGVGVDSGESEENLKTAKEILSAKGVTYRNISPNPENEFYRDFISQINGYPTTYLVDSQGNIVGAPIIGVVMGQEKTLNNRIETILNPQ